MIKRQYFLSAEYKGYWQNGTFEVRSWLPISRTLLHTQARHYANEVLNANDVIDIRIICLCRI